MWRADALAAGRGARALAAIGVLAAPAALAALAAIGATGAGCSPPPAPGPRLLVEGEKVLAPWSRSQVRYAGHVTETYGRLVGVAYVGGGMTWVPAVETFPPGVAGPEPADGPEACSVRAGDSVVASWWTPPGARLRGSVTETYGKLGFVELENGEHNWYACAELERQAAPVPVVAAGEGAGGPAVGSRVTVRAEPPSRGGKGRVAEVHGRLAWVFFEDGPPAWIELSRLEPPAAAGPVPPAAPDPAVGSTVLAPEPVRGVLRPAQALEAHGKLLRVRFEGGVEAWVRGFEVQPR